MNGWWWDPSAPGRGFFVEYADAMVRVACCFYDEAGNPAWQVVGPAAPGPEFDVVDGDLHLTMTARDRARLQWRGEKIELAHQHAKLREDALTWHSPLSGWWIEDKASSPRTFVCEQLNGQLFAALLTADAWLLYDGRRDGDQFRGTWHRFEGGQPAGGPYRAPTGRILREGALALAHADGTLQVQVPDGATARFVRPAPIAARTDRALPLEVIFSAAGAGKPSCGLVGLSLEAEGGPASRDGAYDLVLESSDPRVPRFRESVRLDGWARKLAMFVNTHLLPNGRVPFTVKLLGGGQEAWRHDFALHVANEGPLAEKVRESLRARNAPLVIVDSVDSSHYDMSDPALRPWFDRPDAFEHVDRLRAAGRIDAQEDAALRKFAEEGFLVLPGAIEDPLLDRIASELDDAVKKGVQGYAYGSSQRIRNLHQDYGGVKSLWRHPKVMRMLELIFEVPARPCQTLTYVFGSQQEAHQDTVHLTPFPAGYMCGVWVALEDVKPDSGELEVFPGTHRLPRIYMNGSGCAKVTDDNWDEFGEKIVAKYRDMLGSGGFSRLTYRPKRGTVLVWHENLLHGGSVRKDTSLSRRSIVSHYFADGAIAFYDSTGRPGHME